MSTWQTIRELVMSQLVSLINTDWHFVHFRHTRFVLTLAVVFAVGGLLLQFIRRRKGRVFYSGSGFALERSEKAGLLYRCLRALPLVLVLSALLFHGLVAADPYIVVGDNSEVVRSRLVMYLVDASTSMAWRFRNYPQSRAEIVQDFLLNLLEKRRPKHDSVAIVRFETTADVISDFTDSVDSQRYFLYSMPMVVTFPNAKSDFPGSWVLTHGVLEAGYGHGSTRLDRGLEASYKHFDARADQRIKDRSIVIVTDGAADTDPENEFKELQKRHIIPYLVFIEPDLEVEHKYSGDAMFQVKKASAEKVQQLVRRSGGQVFQAGDKQSLQAISDKLDALQPSITETKHYSNEIPVYQRFEIASLFCLILAGLMKLLLISFQRVA